MKIYTSYFAKADRLPSNIIRVAICRFQPKWFTSHCEKMIELAPSQTLLFNYKQNHDETAYTAQYNAYLQTLNAADVVNKLAALSNGKDVALLCYERPSDFCHRHLVAHWLSNNGIDCSEYAF